MILHPIIDLLKQIVIALPDYASGLHVKPKRMIAIGHRGAMPSVYPENSIVSIAGAAKLGFDYAEIDVRATSDGVLVCLHDAAINTVARNADGSKLSSTINIADITYSQAQEYVFCSTLYSTYPTLSICTLEDAIKTCASCGIGIWFDMYIEPTNAVLSQIFGWLDDYNMRDNAVFNSATYNYVSQIHSYDETVAISTRSSTYASLDAAINGIKAFDSGRNLVFVNTRHESMAEYAPAFHERGWFVVDSTLDDIETMAVYAPYIDAVLEEDFVFTEEIADYLISNTGQAVTSLLNLNRTETNNASSYYNESYYINPAQYESANPQGTACTVANLTENSITVTCITGGRGCAFPFDISAYYGKTLTLTWDATGTSNTRFRLLGYGNSNWIHTIIDNTGAKNTSSIVIASDGKTITVDGTAITASSNPFTFISFFFGAATSQTVAYSNVFLESN